MRRTGVCLCKAPAVGLAILLVMSIASLILVTPGTADARDFGIDAFTIRTTIPQEVAEGGAGGFRVVNKPYNFTQAGGHPYALTTTIVFKHEEISFGVGEHDVVPTEDPKDVVVDLPPGLIGDPQAMPKCPITNVTDKKILCPTDTQIGSVRLRQNGESESLGPIYNVTPELGQSAEFALVAKNVDAIATAHLVHINGEYGITVVSNDLPSVNVWEIEATFWGVPGESRYNWLRGLACERATGASALCHHEGLIEGRTAGVNLVPFLTMPTGCTAGQESGIVHADSWEHPGHVVGGHFEGYAEGPKGTMPGVTGCNLLKFSPGIAVHPDTLLADEPIGLNVNVSVPQTDQPGSLGTPHLRKATVTLPPGVSVSPGIVDGIEACNASGPDGINFEGPESEEKALNGEFQLAPGHCPDASVVGEAEAETPLLASPVKGHVYLARPGCGGEGQAPCTEQDALDGNLYKLYLELGGKGALGNAGVNIKVEGRVQANLATGQLTAVFDDNPQTPFNELRLRMNGGPRAPLDNPATCGRAQTVAAFTPWSAPGFTPEGMFVAGIGDANTSSYFNVAGCQSPSGLAPGFTAGTVTPNAAKFSTFTMSLTRKDREQYIKRIRVETPPGLSGVLSSVSLCQEPAANNGTCPAASKIGTTRVASGAGSHPFEIEGDVYLTGPYESAPFGLSVVTHAVAGPFDLGTVVVRAQINVNQQTATLRVTTDEVGPHAIPQIIFGVPLRLQQVTVNIDRTKFMFNPTNCSAQQITATIAGSQGAVAKASAPFAVGGCASLGFKPNFRVATNARATRVSGASLDARLTYPSGAMGRDSNIARVKVSLPKQLPSRLTTLQRACPAEVFEDDPAACPSGAVVGVAKTTTPLLPVKLEGPVYFVSHGGNAFPSLVVVLQGDNVRVDLTGETFINKAGITSSAFKTVPDVPVNSFELYLPQGKYSALAANGNLCREKANLRMPTELVAQNGMSVKQSTVVKVRGCPIAKGAIGKGSGARAKTHGRSSRSVVGRTGR